MKKDSNFVTSAIQHRRLIYFLIAIMVAFGIYSLFAINKDEFNIYAVEINESEIRFYINGEHTFSYAKMEPTPKEQYPFCDHPFYIILSAQLGGTWVGKVNPDDLPVKMEIDYVKFYERR